jgi:hypothetical protein
MFCYYIGGYYVESSSVADPTLTPWNVIRNQTYLPMTLNEDDSLYFKSKIELNPWISIDLKSPRIVDGFRITLKVQQNSSKTLFDLLQKNQNYLKP